MQNLFSTNSRCAFSIGKFLSLDKFIFEIISIAFCHRNNHIIPFKLKLKTYDKLDIIPKFLKLEINNYGINAKCSSKHVYNIFLFSNYAI